MQALASDLVRDGIISDATIDEGIAAWVRTGMPGPSLLETSLDSLLHRIDLNGLASLLSLKTDPSLLSVELAAALRKRLIGRELWEEQHRRIVAEALAALGSAGLTPLLFKGTALAWSHYPRPSARMRGDSDILVEEDGRVAAMNALEAAGFQQPVLPGGVVLFAETIYQKADPTAQVHDIDLHWRLNSSPVLATLFDHGELLAHAVDLPGLGVPALRFGDIDALLFASVHRQNDLNGSNVIYLDGVPHPGAERLTALLDIHLLAASLSGEAINVLEVRAMEKGLGPVLAEVLRAARSRFGTPVDEALLARLKQAAPSPATRYLSASYARRKALDFLTTKGLAAKGIFLKELLFPSPAYMRAAFRRGRYDWLPVLYLRRASSRMAAKLKSGKAAS